MRCMFFAFFIIVIVQDLLAAPVDLDALPVAPIRNVTDTYFDETINDPYRWLEDLKNPETQQWMKAQSDYTRRVLDAIPDRVTILERLKVLNAATPGHTNLTCVREASSGDIFFLHRFSGEETEKLYMRKGWNSKDRLLFDPGTLKAKIDQPQAINYVYPSQEGSYVAVGTSAGGSEKSLLWVLDTKTGRIVDGPIDRSYFSFANVSWLPGGKSMLIRRFQQLDDAAPATEKMLNRQVWLHRLVTPIEQDSLVFGNRYSQKLDLAPQDFPGVYIAATSPYVIAVKAGARSEMGLFVIPRKNIGKPGAVWRKLFDYNDQVIDVAIHSDSLYVLSTKNAPKGHILKVDLSRDSPPVEFFPEGKQTIDLLGGARDALYFRQRHGVYERLMRLDYRGGSAQEIQFDTRGSISSTTACGTSSPFALLAMPDIDGVNVRIGSWIQPYALYRVLPKARRAVKTDMQPAAQGVDLTRYVVDDLTVPSYDGVQVPLSVVRPKAFVRDGSHRMLLKGYGAYGFNSSPRLNETDPVWLEQGIVRATCHVRGGGEYGEAWHRAGWQKTKANTWKDFIACAEFLIREKYTSTDKLIGTGTSAGGVMIGNAIIERPDLFRAAIISVGVLDTLRSVVAGANGPNHYAEWGDPKTRDGFESLLAASAYLKVKNNVDYPAVLLVQGVNDARVDVWESTKMAARLQAASSSGKPVLLRLDYNGGHLSSSAADDARSAEADLLAFALWQTQDAIPAH